MNLNPKVDATNYGSIHTLLAGELTTHRPNGTENLAAQHHATSALSATKMLLHTQAVMMNRERSARLITSCWMPGQATDVRALSEMAFPGQSA